MRERNLKKGGKIRRQLPINIIRQKERNKINLNLLNYFKWYSHRDFGKK